MRARTLAALAALSLLVACSVEEPALPTLESRWAVPLGSLEWTTLELLEGEDALRVGEDGLLAFHAEGELDSFAVGERLDVHLGGEYVQARLGEIDLEPSGPVDFSFALAEIHPQAALLDGGTVPVPAFDFDLDTPAQDLPGFTAARIARGALLVRLQNGLPVAVGGTGPQALRVELAGPVGGPPLLVHEVEGALAPGSQGLLEIDVAGVELPDSLRVRLRGGSPGSATPVTVDAGAVLSLGVETSSLSVTAAQAPVGVQDFRQTTRIALPDSVRILAAELASGELTVHGHSDLPVAVRARVTLPAFLTPEGQPLRLDLDLPPGASALRVVDLADHRLDFGGVFGEELLIETRAETPGSGGESVWIEASDQVRLTVEPLDLSFRVISGTLDPRTVVLDPTTLRLDLPEDLERVRLTDARLRLDLESSLGLPGRLRLRLEGTSSAGSMVPLDLDVDLPASPAKTRTVVVLDPHNSDLLDFLNNRPETVQAAGEAAVGDGSTVGTVRTTDGVSARYAIDAPLEAVVDAQEMELDAATVDLDADLRDRIRERVVEMDLVATVRSTLPLAAEAWLCLDTDPAALGGKARLRLGPVHLPAAAEAPPGADRTPVEATSTLHLDREQIAVVTEEGLWQQLRLVLPGSGGAAVRLRASDAVQVRGRLEAVLRLGEDREVAP